jgi:hypothetical protein
LTQREYAARIRKLGEDAKNIDAAAGMAALDSLREAHVEVLRSIAALPTGSEGGVSYSRHQLEQLRRAIERSMDEFSRQMTSTTKTAMEDKFQAGSGQVDAMLKDAIGVQPALTILPRHNLVIAQDYTADLVTGLSESAKAKLNAVLRRSALGGQSVDSIMRQIGKSIGEGEFGKISRRAQTIYRTEVGRMAHAAAQSRMEEAAESVEGLEHQWVHCGFLETHPRGYHLMIHGEHVPVDEPFPGSGPNSDDDLMYPGDAAGAAEDTINCMCDTTAWTPMMEKFAPLAGSKV